MRVIRGARREERNGKKEAVFTKIRVISRGLSLSNSANVYSCCRKTQRRTEAA